MGDSAFHLHFATMLLLQVTSYQLTGWENATDSLHTSQQLDFVHPGTLTTPDVILNSSMTL